MKNLKTILLKIILKRKFLFALVTVISVFVVNFMMTKIFTDYTPMSLFLVSVLISAWIGGIRAGIFATLLGAFIELAFFSNPRIPLFSQTTEVARLLFYLLEGFIISYIFSKFHEAQKKAAQSQDNLNQSLKRETRARRVAERMLQKLRTSQKHLNEEREIARNANRMKTLFLAHMSHEIRTPLVAILGFTELLKDESLPAKQRQQYLDIIDRTGNNLHDIINDILDISKVEAGHFEIAPETFSLSHFLNEIHAILALKASEKNIDLQFLAQGPIPQFIFADPKRIRQILINLVGNSIKFTEQGSVKVLYRTDECSLIFCIQDSGIGISENQKPQLFKNFCQGDDSISRGISGTGLGLALSKKMAQMLGGDVRLLSSKLSEGSVFEFDVKFTHSEPTLAPVPAPCANSTGNLTFAGKNILIVDDSEDNQLLFTMALKKMGCLVSVASNGLDALIITEHQTFDLILMDMQMPGMDGYTATNRLKARGCTTPVIALTANALKEDRMKCIDAGCDDYISKPIKPDQLRKILILHVS